MPRTNKKLWITVRKGIQYLSLLIFMILFIISPRGKAPWDLINLPMRLDPLLTFSHLLSSRVFLLASSISLLIIMLTLVFGRAWCGWLCPLGTILDLFSLDHWRNPTAKPLSESWRGVKYFLLIVILTAALFSNMTLLILDPLTIVFRTLTTSILPASDKIITTAERFLYKIPFLDDLIPRFDMKIRPVILPQEPLEYQLSITFFILFGGIIALNLVASRFWCRYICPLGGMLGLISKVAIYRRYVNDDCKGCKVCTQACPTGTINPEKDYSSDPSECTMCLDCLEACPRGGVSFKPHFYPASWNEYDPGRRYTLAAIGSTIAGIALLKSSPPQNKQNSHILRPPGVDENEFLSKCVRCAECVRACPTGALQPALNEAGLEGIWTPILIPRLGNCDFSCNTCGLVCPVEAIPPLSLEIKRTQIIGHAYIDSNRCIAWADHQDCIVCEEMCPIPDKAIFLEKMDFLSTIGEITTVQLPHVNRDVCIGCGVCEYKCPVAGEAAIRVYTKSEPVS